MTSWRNLSQSEVSWSPLLRGFTQFGELVDDVSVISMQFMLNRLCIPAPLSRGQIFETGEEMIFKLNRNKGNYLQCKPANSGLTMSTVPIIIVFTKFDLFVAQLNMQRGGKDKISLESAERNFKEEHSQALEKWMNNISSQIPYNVAASMFVS